MPHTIAILAPSSVPFQIGGAEKLWWGMHRGLAAYSNSYVELLKLPCREESFAGLVDSYHAFSELNLSHFDMVISTKYPAWMARHHNHVLYMQHPLRGLYDTYHFTGLPETLSSIPAPLRDLLAIVRKADPTRDDLQQAFELIRRALNAKSLPSDLFNFPGPLIREVVHFFDRVALAPSQISAYAAISATVRNRKGYFPAGADVKILHHPSDITEYCRNAGRYIFTASRLTSMKRVHLVVEAMRHVTEDIPLKIAGTGPELEHLKMLAGDDRRIEFLGYVPDVELPKLYGNSLFVPFVPYDEDYGLITIEAMHSGKSVVTVTDSGGVREFVEDGVTGFCTAPTPEALGAAMQRLASSPALAAKLGASASERVRHLTWEESTRALLSHAATAAARRAQGMRQKIIVCSTFAASEAISGGQRRLYQLCKALAQNYFVLLLCLGAQTQRGMLTTEIMPHFHEIRLPWTKENQDEAERLLLLTGASADDLSFMRTCANHDLLLETLRVQGGDAACIVSSHPFMFPAIRRELPHLPLIYDAHNVESDMKAAVLGNKYPELLHEIADVEKECALVARSVLTCSNADAQRFAELYGLPHTHCCRIPNGCDCSSVLFAGAEERRALRQRLDYPDAKLALFIGSGHKPNMDAAAHIIRLASSMPEVHFLVAGSVSTQAVVREIPRPGNVHMLGIVSEPVKNMLLRAADVGLNPVISGSGTNLKIIEYVVAGLETVSTLFGLRGLDEDFCPCVHACGLDEFPQGIRRILATPAPEPALAAASRRAADHYAWPVAMRPLAHIVKDIMAPARGTNL